MIAIEESIKEEENAFPAFLDEDAYVTKIFIGGALLEGDTVVAKLAELEEQAERISEEDAVTAMKALRVLDDRQSYSTRDVRHMFSRQAKDFSIFGRHQKAHVLKEWAEQPQSHT